MRTIFYGALLAIFVTPSVEAAEIVVLSPPLVRDGLNDLAGDYARQTGITVTVKSDVMGKIMADIETATPAADVIILPPDLMDTLEKNGGVKPGTRAKLGRVEIGLAVPAGAPHPNISTVAQLGSALRGAKMVVYSKPGPPRNSVEAGIIDTILKQPEFTGVHSTPVETGSGIMALVHGEGDMAMQVIPEITPHKEVELVGPLPAKLGAHIDTAIAISARSGDASDAQAFIRYVMSPHAKAVWKVKGLDRF
jgi:molybdate transport system substrate-binding protein